MFVSTSSASFRGPIFVECNVYVDLELVHAPRGLHHSRGAKPHKRELPFGPHGPTCRFLTCSSFPNPEPLCEAPWPRRHPTDDVIWAVHSLPVPFPDIPLAITPPSPNSLLRKVRALKWLACEGSCPARKVPGVWRLACDSSRNVMLRGPLRKIPCDFYFPSVEMPNGCRLRRYSRSLGILHR